AVGHLPVEVVMKVDDVRAESDHVEPGVATYKRVEGPGDDVDAEPQTPVALVQLERAAHVAALRCRHDAGDVRVKVRCSAHVPDEPGRRAQKSITFVRASDVGPDVGEDAEDLCRDRRLVRRGTPHLDEQGLDGTHVGNGADLTHFERLG